MRCGLVRSCCLSWTHLGRIGLAQMSILIQKNLPLLQLKNLANYSIQI